MVFAVLRSEPEASELCRTETSLTVRPRPFWGGPGRTGGKARGSSPRDHVLSAPVLRTADARFTPWEVEFRSEGFW